MMILSVVAMVGSVMAISSQVHADLRKASVKQKQWTLNSNNTLEFDRHFWFPRTIRESQA